MMHVIAIGKYVQTHVLGIFLAIVVSYIIGFLWHGPLFGKLWIKLNGIKQPKKEDMKFSMMLPGLTANLVLIFVQSAVMGRAFQLVSMTSVADALIIATLLWLPFTALVIINIYAWVGKPVKLMMLDCAHALLSMWAVATVLYFTL